ncbi:Polymyxin resistance protein ArnT, undecaprenyl phosphate-alpha-L-Ara4N transferase; Melittin resistance protein PqaB [Georgfuchsia toluolica]|uniref:Polymyxin resistance protein ArnT, undecaprenyl phosphate-alpha-L-Ara4N transferase Melittin resistance protein PqaB n=1 Tax=Georgfuchsia toluolica TaxID=424218 RepID=A0A916NH66_9PROT|nr:glycosyltransferase family 39 protein [Georgfuchsia toluolica]CAG4882984.1 Polymyxin resistance protein ArnT, undecaprenyl phosphate-alpha-L-Ara4N transferase; Melittin resistance protein PqaB [Georgfuchsia toluolica]
MRLSNRAIWLLWIALFAVWFGTLDYRKLIRPDEGRYAEIPREMVASGDWLTPRLNGFKYFEKPTLQYWATATAYEVFGEDEWTARLWPALTGFLSVLLAAWTGRRLWGAQAGNLAAAILASTLCYVIMSHIITLDMGLSFFLQMAWTAFLFAQQGDAKTSRHWMWLLWTALALAVLSKGLVALVLCGATLVAYTLFNRDFSPWKRLAPCSGLALFLAIAAPWFIAVSIANPEFARFFFIHEHFERFLTTAHRRYQPDWYFLQIYALGALPWTFLLLHALFKSWRRDITVTFQTQRFLALWVLITFGFFSVSSSKLPPYILPIFPALALLGGRHLAELPRRQLLSHLAVLAVLVIAAIAFLPRIMERAGTETTAAMLNGYLHWLLTSSTLLLAAIFAAMLLTVKQHNAAALLALAVGATIAGFGTLLGHQNLALSNSAFHVATQVKPLLTPGVPFYSVNKYEQTLPFYIKRTVTLVNYQGELAFGIKQEPDKWVPTTAEFKQRWASDRDAFAIMSIDNYNGLAAEQLPMSEIARDTRNVIVRKNNSPPTPRSRSGGDGCSAAQNAASASMADSFLGQPCERATQ